MSVQVSARRRLRLIVQLGVFVFLAVPATFVAAAAIPEDAPILISETNSTRALFTLNRRRMNGPIGQRVVPVGATATVYLTNLELLKNEDETAFRADITDQRHYRYPLEIVSFEPMPDRPWVHLLTFRLHPQIGDVGDALLRVTWRGMSSNRVRISIGHEGGKIEDDDGAEPTPMPDTPIVRARNEAVGLPWTGDRVRFMMQAGFGVTDAFESRLRRIGFSTWIAEQMEQKYQPNGLPRYSSLAYPSYKTLETIPPVSCNGTGVPGSTTDPPDVDPLCFRNHYTMFPLQNWMFREAMYGEDQQLRRRVSWALSQILVVGGRETVQSGRMMEYIKILDKHAFGNFKVLLHEVTLNPAMGNYLDMARSTNVNPNENYPREILQLFSIGLDQLNQNGTPVLDGQGNKIPTYNQATVDNFTKVFTGWTFCGGPECPNRQVGIVNYIDPMSAIPANHDNGQKVLFNGEVLPAGLSPEEDLRRAIENIFAHPNVAPFISKLLIQQMVTSNPTPAYVGRVAAVFSDNGSGIRGDLKAVVRAILMDPEARGNLKTDPDYGHLREPVLLVTNLVRPFNPISQAGSITACNGLSDGVLNPATLPLDQDVWNPPTVFNYYPLDYVIPSTGLAGPEFGIMSTSTSLRRINFVNQFVPPNNNPLTAGIQINTAAPSTNLNYSQCGTRIDTTRLMNIANSDLTGGELVETLNREMLAGSMSAGMRADILGALQAIQPENGFKRARTALYLVASSPQFQVQR